MERHFSIIGVIILAVLARGIIEGVLIRVIRTGKYKSLTNSVWNE
jgi:hypothetical protein